jgi:AcrR family transcriptional regulator
MDMPDRRKEKTRTAIYQALSVLLQKKKYANITIQEIIDQANVGRTTFYSHFTDKDALLSSCIESIFESLSDHLAKNAPINQESHHIIPVAELFAHFQENSRLINGILISDSGDLLFEKFKSYWGGKVESYLTENLPNDKKPEVPIDIVINYVTSVLTELLRWWMKSENKYTPVQMEQYLFALIIPSISSILGE